jgi:hypothetical protein
MTPASAAAKRETFVAVTLQPNSNFVLFLANFYCLCVILCYDNRNQLFGSVQLQAHISQSAGHAKGVTCDVRIMYYKCLK